MHLENGRWQQTDNVEGRSRGTRATRNGFEAYAYGHETRFADRGRPTGADGGAVALRLMLMSCFLSLPDHAPLASYRLGSSVRVVRYGRVDSSLRFVRCGRALRAAKRVVAKLRRNPDALHSLCIGGATTLTAGGETFRNE